MDGTICTPQDLELEYIHCLTRPETMVLTVRAYRCHLGDP
jgi:hypothetical protein